MSRSEVVYQIIRSQWAVVTYGDSRVSVVLELVESNDVVHTMHGMLGSYDTV